MTPSAEPASAGVPNPDASGLGVPRTVTAGYLVPANLLQDGEIVILVVKPSSWLALFSSLPVMTGAAVAALLAAVIGNYYAWFPEKAAASVCLAVLVARAMAGCWQWLGTTYVLTNRRIVIVRGVVTARWSGVLLTDVGETLMEQTAADRLVGTGNIHCFVSQARSPKLSWITVTRPEEVHPIVREAIRQAGKPRQG